MAVKSQKLNIPEQALQVLRLLERAGNKAYFVGQCVAELLKGGSPMDYDIITDADFSEMLYVFREMRIVSQNEELCSVMVSSLGLVIQVSCYCSEIKDGKAVYTDNYLFDLARRDFSVNAIAYHPRKGFRDPFDGMECIKDGVTTLKAIGEYPVVLWHENDLDGNELTLKLSPKSSIVTNPMNILTALTLFGTENYEIDGITADSIKANANMLCLLPEREVYRAFTKMLLTRNISKVMIRFPEVFSALSPELLKAQQYKDRYFDGTLWEHIAKSVEFAPPAPQVRYAALFHNCGIPDCKCRDSHGNISYGGHTELGRITAGIFLCRYHSEQSVKSDTDMLIEYHDISFTEDRVALKRLFGELSYEELKKLIKLRIADDMAKPSVHEGQVAMYRRISALLDDIAASGECCSKEQLAVKEKDLIARRLVSNKAQAAAVINSLFEAVLAEPKLNVAPVLLDMVRKSVRR